MSPNYLLLLFSSTGLKDLYPYHLTQQRGDSISDVQWTERMNVIKMAVQPT